MQAIKILLVFLVAAIGASFYAAEMIMSEPPAPIKIQGLYTSGDKILGANTGERIILKGIVSDYFRYKMNYDYPAKYGGLEAEFEKIDFLRSSGADINIIGLYLARLEEIKAKISEMDRYIQYAYDNGMYVYLAPTGNAFFETNDNPGEVAIPYFFEDIGPNDLTLLTEFLAKRYGHLPHVLYYLTAEPNASNQSWDKMQLSLANVVRQYTDNPIIVSTPYYSPYSRLPIIPHENVVYSVGGYVSKDDNSKKEREIPDIIGRNSPVKSYPVIISEFGGNYGGDFSSLEDLERFREILKEINIDELSYTVYRLSSAFENDGLALFDTDGSLSKKGSVYVNSFHRN